MMVTPCYIIDTARVSSNWHALKEALCPDELYYAMKCNSDLGILKVIAALPDGRFEVASDGEMEQIVSLGVAADRVICSTPIKPLSMLERLVQLGCRYFVFDTYHEFGKIKKLASTAKKIVRLDITSVVPDTIPFGLSVRELRQLIECRDVAPQEIDGVTFYILANKSTSKVLQVLDLVESVLKILPQGRVVNLGGNYRLPEEVDETFYVALRQRMDDLRIRFGCVFYAEPGRSIAKSACTLRSRVVCVKQRGDDSWVYLDAGVPTGISYKPPKLDVMGRIRLEKTRHYHFYDTTCSHRELFDADLDVDIQIGDLLMMQSVGSYYLSKACGFHGWGPPNVVRI